jgi:N-formylmaleamate deformylase
MNGSSVDLQSDFVGVNHIKVHYYRTGGDKPPIVLSHGAGDDGSCWSMTAEGLSEDYDVIMPDARGHGLSSEGGGNYSPEIRTDDLNAFIDALGLENPILAGHSMGAESSMRLAVRHPDRVRAAILEDPVLVMPGETVFGGWFGQSFQNSPEAIYLFSRH